jgi:hypothetical protein
MLAFQRGAAVGVAPPAPLVLWARMAVDPRERKTIGLPASRWRRLAIWRRARGIDTDSQALEFLIDNRLEEIMVEVPRPVRRVSERTLPPVAALSWEDPNEPDHTDHDVAARACSA